jgi:hypothetical protein
VIFYGTGAVLIRVVGSHARWLGLLLFGVYALILIAGALNTAFTSMLGVLIVTRKIITMKYSANDFWWDLVNAVQVAETCFYGLYLVSLWRYFFGGAP